MHGRTWKGTRQGTKENEGGVKVNVRVFALNTKEGVEAPDTMTSTLLIHYTIARVLFDSWANQSFIDLKLKNLLNLP